MPVIRRGNRDGAGRCFAALGHRENVRIPRRYRRHDAILIHRCNAFVRRFPAVALRSVLRRDNGGKRYALPFLQLRRIFESVMLSIFTSPQERNRIAAKRVAAVRRTSFSISVCLRPRVIEGKHISDRLLVLCGDLHIIGVFSFKAYHCIL